MLSVVEVSLLLYLLSFIPLQRSYIHIYVSDKNTAEKWYAETLGFTRIIDFEVWNVDEGPLFICNDCIR